MSDDDMPTIQNQVSNKETQCVPCLKLRYFDFSRTYPTSYILKLASI